MLKKAVITEIMNVLILLALVKMDQMVLWHMLWLVYQH